MKKTYVLDTNVLIQSPLALLAFKDNQKMCIRDSHFSSRQNLRIFASHTAKTDHYRTYHSLIFSHVQSLPAKASKAPAKRQRLCFLLIKLIIIHKINGCQALPSVLNCNSSGLTLFSAPIFPPSELLSLILPTK